MNITATTTDAEILSGVAYAHGNIVGALEVDSVNFNSEPLAKLVNQLAEAEGIAQARANYRDMLSYGASEYAITRELVKMLANGSDDERSGRTNDVRRARFDGIRTGVREILNSVGVYV